MPAKIYVINLPKDVERLEWFRMEMRTKWPGMAYEVVPAIVGKEIPDEVYARLVDAKRAKALFGREMGRGEAGLVLSHHAIFNKMIADKVEVALVFEDDVRLGTQLKECFSELVVWCEKQSVPVALLLSEAHKVRKWLGTPLGKSGVRICKPLSIYGTYGFMINLQAAKALLAFTTPVFCFADDWARFHTEAKIQVYSIVPFLVGNNDFERKKSSLSEERAVIWHQSSDAQKKRSAFSRLKCIAHNCLLKIMDRLTGVTVIQVRSNNGLL